MIISWLTGLENMKKNLINVEEYNIDYIVKKGGYHAELVSWLISLGS
ncbi:unnamed protein product [marine sediment metagenome]|uniref:Uncharacterized protein n=1 Tax=marine sediment metagenome TaxID=412755 RepID=X1VHG9_9ZZZZ